MKKIFLVLSFVFSMLLFGCSVNVDINTNIKDDSSGSTSLIMYVERGDYSEAKSYFTNYIDNLKDKLSGVKVSDYSNDSSLGYKISYKFKDLDGLKKFYDSLDEGIELTYVSKENDEGDKLISVDIKFDSYSYSDTTKYFHVKITLPEVWDSNSTNIEGNVVNYEFSSNSTRHLQFSYIEEDESYVTLIIVLVIVVGAVSFVSYHYYRHNTSENKKADTKIVKMVDYIMDKLEALYYKSKEFLIKNIKQIKELDLEKYKIYQNIKVLSPEKKLVIVISFTLLLSMFLVPVIKIPFMEILNFLFSIEWIKEDITYRNLIRLISLTLENKEFLEPQTIVIMNISRFVLWLFPILLITFIITLLYNDNFAYTLCAVLNGVFLLILLGLIVLTVYINVSIEDNFGVFGISVDELKAKLKFGYFVFLAIVIGLDISFNKVLKAKNN